jgi:hypothetical protein
MKEIRRKIIEDKIFTKSDIRNIYKIVNSEYEYSKKAKNHSSLELELNCQDRTSYESESDDLLNDGDIIDTKRCVSVSIEYHDYNLERKISVTLKHGRDYNNEFIVSGLDRNWVSGIFDRIDTTIDSVKPQKHWFIQYKSIILHVSAFFFGLMIYRILDILWYQHIESINTPSEIIQAIRDFIHKYLFVLYTIQGILFWLQGVFPVWYLRDWVLKLWPSVEFDFGPEHQKSEKNKRNRLELFFFVIIVPLLISFIYDLIKYLR